MIGFDDLANPPYGGFVYQPEAEWPDEVVVHSTYVKARTAMVRADFIRTQKYQDQQWRAMRIGAHPQMLLFTRLLIAKAKRLNIPLFASEIVRTPERQAQLYADGFSKAIGAKAPHVFGCAADIVHSTLGWSLEAKQWELLGKLGKELAIQRTIPIVWGGDWPPLSNGVGWDPAHWQLKHWREEMTGFPFMPPETGVSRR